MRESDYEWYVTLAELQHVTAAAEQLHIAQPTLTRMLSRLEQRLGVALFDRRGKRLALNAYGRIFYEHACRAQLELDSSPTRNRRPDQPGRQRDPFGVSPSLFGSIRGGAALDCGVHGSLTASGVHAAGGRRRIDR